MIQITDEIHARYLAHNPGMAKQFLEWLDKLGFSRLPYNLTLFDLVNFGWIEPALRVDVPESFYLTWKNYPELPADDSEFSKDDEWALFCSPYLYPTLDEPPKKWFLHVFDKPDSEAREFLRHKIHGLKKIPNNKKHPTGYEEYNTCWLYFAHWQGYFLVDLLTSIEIFPSVPNIPDAIERLELFKKQYPERKIICDARIRAIKEKWEGRREFFELISYYRTMLGLSVHYILNCSTQEREALRKEGRRLLAEYLKLTPETIEKTVEELLVVFQEWTWATQRESHVYGKAIGQIRKDIFYAVEWLCTLSGESIDTYFKKWRYPDRSQREWAELKTALPFEYKETIDYFLYLAPHYLEKFNKGLSKRERLQGEKLEDLIKKLFREYPAFRRFCRAFYKLHDYTKMKDEIDFREFNAFLDYFLLLALRTEIVLLAFADSGLDLDKDTSLRVLLMSLSSSLRSGSVKTGVNLAIQHWKKCTSLKTRPPDPFQVIKNKIQNLSCRDQGAKKIAEYILTAGMLRNYFAHHNYFDHVMVKREYAAKGLTSLLVTVLFLASALQA
ncbi:hypothetical protein DBT_1150 [Dissulfuribacter thermophilus]|uniref:Uncharacterized protein n=1 Tax=Dissulfuribacter thermophilus TaxID=1156395 RepID=A0A1B9F695_9BACT|nr:hypothetical protein [Dissulfuribacter thermophilus]OCC15403.1 hypothetical protein DBT_1150 [Dissulfuribacter thermophilus]